MKKALLLLVSLVALLTSSCVENDVSENLPVKPESSPYTISVDRAKEEVETLLSEIDITTRGNATSRKIQDYYVVGETTSTRSGEIDETPLVYIFNFENNAGYAIASGDSRTSAPIFAITDYGYLNPEEGIDIPAMAAFLANMEQIYMAETQGEPELETRATVWYEYSPWEVRGYYGGESFVAWGQRSPYNDLAPYVSGTTIRAAAGCTATALAQTLAFLALRPASYKGYKFDWTQMGKHMYTGNGNPQPNPAAYAQIARLFQLISTPANLDMTWGHESGAYLVNIIRTLKDMGFSNPGTFKDYNTAEVENHLKTGHSPVPVSAYAKHWQTFTKKKFLGITIKTITHDHYDEGHSFVVERLMVRERTKTQYTDGRITGTSKEEQYLVRVNWGWNNYHNGYYFNAAFDSNQAPVYTRSGTSGNYQYLMQVVIGIHK